MIDAVEIAALKQKIKTELQSQILPSAWGPAVVAGGHQFRSLWVRDFCLSVPGLIAAGQHQAVISCLDLIYQTRNQERKMLVRGLDVCAPQWRVFAAILKIQLADFTRGKKLHREFLGEHKTPAFDSNLLWILASLQAGQENWSERYLELLSFYEAHFKDGLIVQPAFSDWQDSARRAGQTFYLNLLYLKIVAELVQRKLIEETRLIDFKTKVFQKFFDSSSGLFLSQPDLSKTQKSLESQLWAVEWDLFSERISQKELYQNLRSSKFFNERKGVPVDEFYPSQEISPTTKAVGLRHYHDKMIWSWLWAEQIRIARKMGDLQTADALLKEFWQRHEGSLAEIYMLSSSGLQKAKTWIYRSEEPFTWGLGKWMQALSQF